MNTESQIEPTIAPLTSPEAADPISTESRRHRRGKVAQLPKATREKINTMIEDGVPLTKILEQLGDETKGITISNLSNWHLGGYKEWLRNRDWNDRLLERQEKFLDATGNDPVKLADAGMQIAATGLCELLDELSRLDTKDENASDRYARLTNAMTRLAKIILTYEQHRHTMAKEKAAEPKQRDPNKPFGDESDHLAVVRVVDKVLGLDRFRQQMMERDAAAAEARTATTNAAQAPVSFRPTPETPAPEVSPSQPQPQTNANDDANRAEASLSTVAFAQEEAEVELPYDWQQFSPEYLEEWKKQHRRNKTIP